MPEGLEFLDQPYRDMAEKTIQKAIKTGKGYDQEWLITTAKGNKRWVHAVATANKVKGKVVSLSGSFQDITDRKMVERELENTLEATTDGIWTWNFKTNVLSFSPRYYTMLGYKPNEFKANFKNWADMIHPDDRDEAVKVAEKYLETKPDRYENEFRLRTKDDDYRWMHTKAKVVERDAEGDAVYMIGSHEDITERKRVEEELKESEAHFKTLSNLTFEGILIHDNGLIVDANQSLLEMFGYSKEEVLGKNIFQLAIPKEHHAEVMEYIKSSSVEPYEIEVIKRDGSHFPAEIMAKEVLIDGNKLRVAAVRDITDRKKAEEDLRESEARFRSYVDHAPDGVFIADENGKYIEVNLAACKITGYSKDELLSMSIPEILQKTDVEKGIQHFKAVKEKGYNQGVIGFVTKSGENRFWEVAAVKLSDTRFLGFVQDVTERKQAEEALKESEDFLNRTGEIARVGGWYLSDDFDKVYWTKTTGRIHELPDGYFPSLEEAINYYHPDDQALVRESVESAIKDGKPFDFETRLITAKGNEIWVQALGHPEMENGKCVRLSGTFQDITLRKKSELELQTNNSLLNATMESTADGILVVDLQGRIVDYNERFLRIWNFDFETLKDGKIKNLVAPENKDFIMKHITSRLEDPQAFIKKVQELYKKPREDSFDTLRFKDGRIIERYSIPQVINNNPVGRVWSFRDVSERKKAEKEIINIAQRLKISTESAKIGIWDYNIQDNILIWDKRMYELYGIKEENFEGAYEAWKKGVHPDDIESSDKEVQDAIAGEKEFHTQFRVVWPDGQIRFIEAHALVIRDPNGEPKSMIGANWDITDQKEAEEDLIKAKNKAEESDRLKSAFLSNMSHEIRTPMNGILGFADLLAESDYSFDDRKKYIEIIRKNGRRLLDTINDIVDVSRIEAGEVQININETNIHEIYDDTLTLLLPEAKIKNIELVSLKTLPHNEIIIQTDKEKLFGIMVNLVKNAIKFTDKGKITMGYRKENDFIKFFVKDTGVGIAKEKQELIFKRFISADNSITRHFEGSGLGLSITKAYVEMLGGKIWVKSEEGSGSVFYFTIPYKSKPHKISEKKQTHSVITDSSKLKDLTLLIVDDEESVRIYLRDILKKECKNVLIAQNGKEAIDICQNNTDIDIILMDIKMPGMNGYKAVKKIREFNKEVVIIAQTAYAMKGDKEKALKAGCNDYIAKPIKKEELLRLIRKYFSK